MLLVRTYVSLSNNCSLEVNEAVKCATVTIGSILSPIFRLRLSVPIVVVTQIRTEISAYLTEI